jgi:hypothetical protein
VLYDFKNLDDIVTDRSFPLSSGTLLHEITSSGNADLILHPVTLALLKIKWDGFARRDVAKQLISYLLFLGAWVWSTQVTAARMVVTLSIATQSLALCHVYIAFGLPFDLSRKQPRQENDATATVNKAVAHAAAETKKARALRTISRRRRRSCSNLCGLCPPHALLSRLLACVGQKPGKGCADTLFVMMILIGPALTLVSVSSSQRTGERIRVVQSWLNLLLW